MVAYRDGVAELLAHLNHCFNFESNVLRFETLVPPDRIKSQCLDSKQWHRAV
jgi:hypothetical protein